MNLKEYLSIENPYFYDEETREFSLYRIALTLTHKCNLSCKLCLEQVPYFHDNFHADFELMKAQIDSFFNIVTYVKKIELAGGEIFLMKDLPLFLDYLMKYKDRFDTIKLLTNGTLLPSQELLNSYKQFGDKADILINNYGEHLSVKYREVEIAFRNVGVKTIIRHQNKEHLHCDGWIDIGDFSTEKTDEDAKKLFNECAIPQKQGYCFRILNGILDPCQPVTQIISLKGYKDTPNEYIDLFDGSSKQEQIDKFLKILHMDMFTACKYCNGMTEHSKRFIPAEQLESNFINQNN